MSARIRLAGLGALTIASLGATRALAPEHYDVILRHGTILDGTGAPRFRGDIGITGNRIARIGDLTKATAALDLDVRGLMVAPGFINIHSHALPAALRTSENMLTQGVTTEIQNPDGGGPLDLKTQLASYTAGGLAENVGVYIGFNSVWASVMGREDKRPTSADVDSMRGLIVRGLESGAFGVSSGLDYKPAYYATIDEVVQVVSPAKPWRTNYANHDRLSPEAGYSSMAGMAETMRVGERAGLVPVFTHMKVQGHEQGRAPEILDTMRRSSAAGRYVTSDAYPYLAGHSGLVSLIVPGWAQNGGRAKMLERFADPEQRARIIKESDDAIVARFGGAKGVYILEMGRELADVQSELGAASPGDAVVRVLEKADPDAILRFGAESDLIKLLQYPATAVACDCGALPSSELKVHPRNWGAFPRILGHYVRETHALTWEDAVRKMSALPASTIGLVDRGFLAPGMMADIAVFDSATVIDRATYEHPTEKSEGIRFVFVNGTLALRDGALTGERGGQALERSGHMPSRPMTTTVARSVTARAASLQAEGNGSFGDGALAVALSISQPARSHHATGTLRVTGAKSATILEATQLGVLQATEGWASITGRARVRSTGESHTFTAIIDRADPLARDGTGTVVVDVEGMGRLTGALTSARVTLAPDRRP